MYSKNDPQKVNIKMEKTFGIFATVNLMLSPLLIVDPSIALVAALLVNGFLISHLHDIGKRRRMGSNLINQGRTFLSGNFFSQAAPQEIQISEIENAMRNIINGGAAVYDEFNGSLASLQRGR